jgi:hypothetical protein
MMSGCHPLPRFPAPESRGLPDDVRQAFLAIREWVRHRPGKLRASMPLRNRFFPIGHVART